MVLKTALVRSSVCRIKDSSVSGVGCGIGLLVVFTVVGVPKIGFPVVASIGTYTPRLSFFIG